MEIDDDETPKELAGLKETLEYWEQKLIYDREWLKVSDFIELSPEIMRIKWNINDIKKGFLIMIRVESPIKFS